MNIDIVKAVPIPKRFNERGASVYPFPQMDVGDSVYIDGEAGRLARSVAYQYGRRFGKKFSARRSSGGFRIWRTA